MGDYLKYHADMLKRIGKIRAELMYLEEEIGDFFIENDPQRHAEDVAYIEKKAIREKQRGR